MLFSRFSLSSTLSSRLLSWRTALLTSSVFLAACGADVDTPNEEGFPSLLEKSIAQAVDNTVVPAAESFVTQTQLLESMSTEFCADTKKEAADISALQQQWQNMASAWFGFVPYLLGPLEDDTVTTTPEYLYIDTLRERGNAHTGTARSAINGRLSDSQTLNEAYFLSLTPRQQGIFALEVALFETSGSNPVQQIADIATDFSQNPRKCELLLGYTAKLNGHAERALSGWTENYLNSGKSFRNLLVSNERLQDDGKEHITLLTESIQSYVDHLHQRNIAQHAAFISGFGWQAATASINSINEYLQGTGETEISFLQLMELNENTADAETVRANLVFLQENTANQNLTNHRLGLMNLDGHLKREIPDSLGVDLGLNFGDGD